VPAQPADHVIVGAGLSGLMLARELLDRQEQGRRPRLVVVEPDLDARPATYACWAREPMVLAAWSVGRWRRLGVIAHDGTHRPVDLDGWDYLAVDWGRARTELLDQLATDPRVTVVPAAAETIRDGAEAASVVACGATWWGRWVYDSRPPSLAELHRDRRRARAGARGSIGLLQTFRGLWVTVDDDRFDPTTATLLDFAADDGPDLGFSYVLPISTRRAMVMAVRMGADAALPDPTPTIEHLVGGGAWRADVEEWGTTPLVVPAPPRRLGRRILAIGRRGGRVRPSTGYALQRILADTRAIGRSLDDHDHPFAIPADPPWQRLLDRVWLHALARERAALEPAFLALFTRTTVDEVLRFLDGQARPGDALAVVRALPPRPFLRALAPAVGASRSRPRRPETPLP
jgi:lycopene beta-cyclase